MNRNLLFFIIVVIASCHPRYYEVPQDDQLFAKLRDTLELSNFETYTFKLEPYFHFKNNESTQSLFSSNSEFIMNNQLFVFKNQKDIFSDTTQHFITDNIFRIDMLLPARDTFKAGDPVFVKSFTYTHDTATMKDSSRFIHIFSGEVGDCINPTGDRTFRMIHIDSFHKYFNEKSKDKSKKLGKITLVVYNEARTEQVRVYAIISSDYESKATEIFDLRKVFGSEIWLTKQVQDR